MRLITILLFVFCFSCISSTSLAQKDTLRDKPTFTTILKMGLLNGEADKAGVSLAFTNGLRYRNWFGGIGAGLDYYGLKSIPLYVEAARDFSKQTPSPFLNAAVGYNFPLRDKNYKSWTQYKSQGGLYYALGGGYKFSLGQELALTLSAAYSFKGQKEELFNDYGRWLFEEPLPPRTDTYTYKFRRLSVNIGFVF